LPLPKRKTSKWSRDQRRHSNWRLEAPNVAACPRCHEPRLPHHACPSCGFYANRRVIEIESKRPQAG